MLIRKEQLIYFYLILFIYRCVNFLRLSIKTYIVMVSYIHDTMKVLEIGVI